MLPFGEGGVDPGLSSHSVLQGLLTPHPLLGVSQASGNGYRTERGLWVLVVAPESKEECTMDRRGQGTKPLSCRALPRVFSIAQG